VEFDFLPALSSSLNLASTCLIVAGWFRVRRRDLDGHRRAMVAALVASAAFLVTYVVHHALHGIHGSSAEGGARLAYQIVLKSHTALSVCAAILVPRVAWLGFKGRLDRHRFLARIALPIWLYVSATGVVLYVMAYHLWPKSAAA
jgi:putative membrane protein